MPESSSVLKFAIRSTRVVVDGDVKPATVWVEGETIRSVESHTFSKRGLNIIDVGNDALMAGLVDSHVHINEPGRTSWEGFATATRAAAAGGVTSVVDMPLNCLPVTTRKEALAVKLQTCEPSLWVDTAFWGGVVPSNADDLVDLVKAGVVGCKAFLIDSGIPEFPETDEKGLRRAMTFLSSCDAPLLAHAEIDLGAPVQNNPRTYESFLASRPPRWEEAAIELLIRLCRETKCAVHIVHLSAASALPLLKAAREEGLPITVETCPHYLTLAADHISDGQTQFKCCPPIRDVHNQMALWQGLADGIIDMVTTDHSPCTPGLKQFESGDFHEAWGGISSLQLGLPLVWTAAQKRGHSLADVARWMSETPAKVAGLSDRKGSIASGMHADLVIWQPEEPLLVTPESLHFKNKVTPYMNDELLGRVSKTFLRGKIVFDDGAFAHAPFGKPLLHRMPSPS